jgi:hypothetical protein
MRKIVLWTGLLAIAGLVLGATFGSMSAGHCIPFMERPIPGATCHRILGSYVSDTTYSAVKMGIVGMLSGLGIGIFVVAPMVLWEGSDPKEAPSLLEYPVIWFGIQLVELLVVIPILVVWVPDDGTWPEPLRISMWIVALVGVTAVNYAIRRRFIPR